MQMNVDHQMIGASQGIVSPFRRAITPTPHCLYETSRRWDSYFFSQMMCLLLASAIVKPKDGAVLITLSASWFFRSFKKSWLFPASSPSTILSCRDRSFFYSLISRLIRKNNSSCSACGCHRQGFSHLIFKCFASETLYKPFLSLLTILTVGPDLGLAYSGIFPDFHLK